MQNLDVLEQAVKVQIIFKDSWQRLSAWKEFENIYK